ncbi:MULTISPECIES: GDP-mannose 4,6-dehydratase [unclassified Helicobacter]|nr:MULTISPECIES: GDP-mannose 4,6-dehydratase [unclassified Helicobacter]
MKKHLLDVKSSIGDSTLAQKELGWNPKNTSFEKLIEIMVLAEQSAFAK